MVQKKDELLRLENQLCFPLYVTSRMLTKAYQPLLDNLGITYPQYLVLLVLWEKDSQTVNVIAEMLYLNTNTITPLLKRMEKMELVRRTRSQIDERKVLITLTSKGKDMKKDAHCIPEEIFKKTGLSIEEIGNLKNQLNKLTKVLLQKEDKAS